MESNGVWFALGMILIFFAICRSVMCWYWRINEIVKELRQINANLERLSSSVAD